MGRKSLLSKEQLEFFKNHAATKTNPEFAELFNQASDAIGSIRHRNNFDSSPRNDHIHVGETFGSLTVLEILSHKKNNKRLFKCLCSCGKERIVEPRNLQRNQNKCRCVRLTVSNKLNRKPPGYASWNMKESVYRCSAKKRNLSWELTSEQFKEICSKDCCYSGHKPKPFNLYIKTDGTPNASIGTKITKESIDLAWINFNGLDRLDSQKGYRLDNVVPCCDVCNYMKLDYSKNDFLDHIKQIFNFQKELNEKESKIS